MELISQIIKKEKVNTISGKNKIVSESLEKVAHKLHNTISVCKSNYIDPYLMDTFINDSKRFYATFRNATTKEEITEGYLTLLRNKT